VVVVVWWWCGGGGVLVVVWCGFFTDYNTTPTNVNLSCFGLLVGLWQYILGASKIPQLFVCISLQAYPIPLGYHLGYLEAALLILYGLFPHKIRIAASKIQPKNL
jgi:hypothetical protein